MGKLTKLTKLLWINFTRSKDHGMREINANTHWGFTA